MKLNLPVENFLPALLAVVEPSPLLPPEPAATHAGKEMFVLMGMLALVAVALLIMVIVMRRKKIRRLNSLSRSAWPASASKNKNPDRGTIQPRESRRHRRRRREHRERNPTLAETGGLPSKRPDDEPPPAL
jgi:hypothetical protein